MTFVQGPETWLKILDLELPCAVNTSAMARLDAEHRIFVNYETYYVAGPGEKETFLARPWQYTGPVTDPVSKTRFVPGDTSLRLDYKDRIFYFQSPETVMAFQAAADSLAVPVVPYSGRM